MDTAEQVGRQSEFTSMTEPAPFSTDLKAAKIRQACDYSIKINLEEAKLGEAKRAPRVYSDGIFDLFHYGHAKQLHQIKKIFPKAYLIVGVCTDKDTIANKGKVVMDQNERYESLRHCRYVDEVIRDAPYIPAEDLSFIEENKIDFIAHDDEPYNVGNSSDVYETFKRNKMFVATQRTKGVSTTELITRIIEHRDAYAMRNMQRGEDIKLGYLWRAKLTLMQIFNYLKRYYYTNDNQKAD